MICLADFMVSTQLAGTQPSSPPVRAAYTSRFLFQQGKQFALLRASSIEL
jgi:hypothetical protein